MLDTAKTENVKSHCLFPFNLKEQLNNHFDSNLTGKQTQTDAKCSFARPIEC